ncbi:MAG: nucleotide exchange factor GrpE [Clostridium sp.]|jgi:molecular chaperone GrpE|nr:nucleotide exchange factor GrpE [Clostridium sp.]
MMKISIDRELKEYYKKKTLEYDENVNELGGSIISIFEDLKNIQKKSVMQGVMKDEQVQSIYRQKLADLESKEIKDNNEIKELKKTEKLFLKNIIKILDELERLKEYGDTSGNEKLSKTLERNFKAIKKYMLELELLEIPTVGLLFNENYHDCVDIKNDSEKDDFEVLEVLRKGYVYKGKVIRAAEVIINRI